MDPAKLAKSGSEHSEQRAYFQALHDAAPHVWKMAFAIPNGAALSERGKTPQARLTGAIRMNRLKAEGLKNGVPDIFIAWPYTQYNPENGAFVAQYAGLFIEMKIVGGVVGSDQAVWHAALRERGYRVEVAYNWQEAMDVTRRYFAFRDQ